MSLSPNRAPNRWTRLTAGAEEALVGELLALLGATRGRPTARYRPGSPAGRAPGFVDGSEAWLVRRLFGTLHLEEDGPSRPWPPAVDAGGQRPRQAVHSYRPPTGPARPFPKYRSPATKTTRPARASLCCSARTTPMSRRDARAVGDRRRTRHMHVHAPARESHRPRPPFHVKRWPHPSTPKCLRARSATCAGSLERHPALNDSTLHLSHSTDCILVVRKPQGLPRPPGSVLHADLSARVTSPDGLICPSSYDMAASTLDRYGCRPAAPPGGSTRRPTRFPYRRSPVRDEASQSRSDRHRWRPDHRAHALTSRSRAEPNSYDNRCTCTHRLVPQTIARRDHDNHAFDDRSPRRVRTNSAPSLSRPADWVRPLI